MKESIKNTCLENKKGTKSKQVKAALKNLEKAWANPRRRVKRVWALENKQLISKECSKCRKIKSVAEFYKNKSAKDGLDHYCVACNLERMRRYIKTEYGILTQQRAYRVRLMKKKLSLKK